MEEIARENRADYARVQVIRDARDPAIRRELAGAFRRQIDRHHVRSMRGCRLWRLRKFYLTDRRILRLVCQAYEAGRFLQARRLQFRIKDPHLLRLRIPERVKQVLYWAQVLSRPGVSLADLPLERFSVPELPPSEPQPESETHSTP